MRDTAGEGWCELHCHCGFSQLDGASMPAALAARAAALGYPALALTDHDSLGGIVAHAQACTEAGTKGRPRATLANVAAHAAV